MHGLEIVRSAFWSPESREPAQWLAHWSATSDGAAPAAIPDGAIPAAQRRRMSPLAKLAVEIALETAGDAAPDFLVFCSQHGDLTRLREMLGDIARGTELSPTSFSQSVHNASAGLFTIIAQSRAPAISLAAGASTFAQGWIEAEGFLLQHPGARVLLVCYDEPLPAEYAPFSRAARCHYALGVLLRRAAAGGITLASAPPERDEPLPLAPRFAAWAPSGAASLRVTADGQGWIFARDAA